MSAGASFVRLVSLTLDDNDILTNGLAMAQDVPSLDATISASPSMDDVPPARMMLSTSSYALEE